jgi:hypothetical protein
VCSGAILTDIERKVNQLDLTRSKHDIIFVAGNDVSSGNTLMRHMQFLELTRSIQHYILWKQEGQYGSRSLT